MRIFVSPAPVSHDHFRCHSVAAERTATNSTIMVNLDVASVTETETPHPIQNLAFAGKAKSFSHFGGSRPRARSESISVLRRNRAMGMSFSGTHTPPPSFREEDIARPRLLSKQLSPNSDSRKKMFQLHSRSHSSPPSMLEDNIARPGLGERTDSLSPATVKEEEEEGVIDEEKQKEGKSLVTEADDETKIGFESGLDFDSPLSETRHASVRVESTSSKQRYIFGRAVPLWITSTPNSGRISTFIAKHAPCFWCSRQINLTTTNQAILKRLGALCGFLGLCQAASASYLILVIFSDSLIDRDAQFVNLDEGASFQTSPALWNVNTYVYFSVGLRLCCNCFVGDRCA